MPSYSLSIVVYGSGVDTRPGHGSHWGLAIERHGDDSGRGDLHHVICVVPERRWYGYDGRLDTQILSPSSEATLDSDKHKRDVVKTIAAEKAPTDGTKGCQDWVLECVCALEGEELIPSGTLALVESLRRTPASNIARVTGHNWEARAR
ncbi:hypothetical protein TWF481_008008 [Arthrobotrys musiformis]|uniref:Uncharacterized protein n=1 Tax=Arthrobotrys musiformis TaxID=47236 RepID=A0AAV9W7X3_9PEZI